MIAGDAEHLCKCLFAIHLFSSVQCSCCQFSIWILFFHVELLKHLCIFKMWVLCPICGVQIFSLGSWIVLFSFFPHSIHRVFCREKKFLKLVWLSHVLFPDYSVLSFSVFLFLSAVGFLDHIFRFPLSFVYNVFQFMSLNRFSVAALGVTLHTTT